jgi:integrase
MINVLLTSLYVRQGGSSVLLTSLYVASATAPSSDGSGLLKACRKSGEPKYTLHAFRNFFASRCLNPEERGGRELSAKIVQTLLGHSSIMMTLDIMATCSATAPTEPSLLHLKKHCSAETQPKAARRPADASYW